MSDKVLDVVKPGVLFGEDVNAVFAMAKKESMGYACGECGR